MLLLSPYTISTISADAQALLSPSPKEVWQAAGAFPTIVADLGQAKSVDGLFLGFTNIGQAGWRVESSLNGSDWVDRVGSAGEIIPGAPAGAGLRHGYRLFSQEFEARWIRLTLDAASYGHPNVQAGVLIIGRSFFCPHERGGGRGVIDTGSRQALIDGGFGGDPGVTKRALRWRFARLTDQMTDRLEDLVLDRGEQLPLVAFEHRGMTPLTEVYPSRRIHYGVFEKLESFERNDPLDTVWAFSMVEWR